MDHHHFHPMKIILHLVQQHLSNSKAFHFLGKKSPESRSTNWAPRKRNIPSISSRCRPPETPTPTPRSCSTMKRSLQRKAIGFKGIHFLQH
ncbi:hypothetical protein PHJA_000280300 [Phtheirospermum japonicum]|uniref:Uncharacterized protein n=1 Tax=Phtheirospermum japonicum TaxID=374723 RepID=A0A830B1B2_9LAMI|nr:hypothetical protein PHJA_000280300 [Phtheirospermum japonicum]